MGKPGNSDMFLSMKKQIEKYIGCQRGIILTFVLANYNSLQFAKIFYAK